jgi:alkanesulfonate monooxygenase SsuD/methylene tetrahydromethanopterin reductase-like flavin-dependent oxidoreductase (luciferase family)
LALLAYQSNTNQSFTKNIDFIFSVQRWLGFGGSTNPAGKTYDSLTFSAAIASITRKIKIYSTVHVSLMHPTFLARSLATIDQISNGRINLNIVCGWNDKEFQMFGIKDKINIDRYKEGEEWVNLLKKILNFSKPTTLKGKYLNAKCASSNPKLYKNRKLNTISAAFSKKGREFALKNCDSLITMFSNLNSLKNQCTSLKRKAKKKYKKKFKVYGLVHVVCKRNDQEAVRFYNNYTIENADHGAIKNFIKILSGGKSNIISALQGEQFKKMAGGIGSYSIVGSPGTVLKKIKEIKKTSVDGIAISFLNFKDELPFFLKNVLKKL